MSGYDPGRSPPDQSRDLLPASQYLQDRLHERRARNTRPKRSRHTDFGPQKGCDDDIFLDEAELSKHARMFDSSPMARSTMGSDAASGSRRRRRTLGIRDMDDQMDRLTKENFALKLELDHRREHTLKLLEQIETMKEGAAWAEAVRNEHQELLQINSQMVSEMEQRDRAVEEAMDIICDLEDRVAELEERNTQTRPSTANADSGYAETETLEHEPSSSPPRLQTQPKTTHVHDRKAEKSAAAAASQNLQDVVNDQTPPNARRPMSIFSEQKPSTQALRSVYMENAKRLQPVKSFQSLLVRQESRLDEDGDPILNSPRLSVLSESSFPSIYSPKQQLTSPDRYAWERDDEEDAHDAQSGPRAHLRHDSIKRVSQWISDRDEDEGTPTKSNSISTSLANRADFHQQSQAAHHQSLNDVLQSVAKSPSLPSQNEQDRKIIAQPKKQKPSSRSTLLGGPIFNEQLLPPTPDSASTRMLRASRSSIADDRSLLDSTPGVVKGYNALLEPPSESGVWTAPRQMRSSVELRTAHTSNLQYRTNALDAPGQGESSDEEDDMEHRRRLGIIGDLELDYDGFPDGKSILMGTPRRFLKHWKPPVSDLMFHGNDFQAAQMVKSSPRRRQSSGNFTTSASAKPRLSRVETSPTILGSVGKMVSSDKSSVESITSPHSVHSGSSGDRTVTQSDDQRGQAISPMRTGPPPAGMNSPSSSRMMSRSPARKLSQKAGTLFRRLSNSQGSDREKTPLPTLTSSPASVYTNSAAAEIKRPRTSYGNDRPSTRNSGGPSASRPPSSRETRRRSLQLRTKTEPTAARPPSSAATESWAYPSDREKRSLFKRKDSQKTQEAAASCAGTSSRDGAIKRRGSLRDAVTTRRPWR